jgi:aryl-phospho-beta-D-glucosidase BglC (GH1 family)
MIGPDSYNSFNRLTDPGFVIPADAAGRLIANFHYYNPWNFCGNGVGKWGEPSDYSHLASDLESVSNWASVHKIPVYLGEFGACDGCDTASRYKWYNAICSAANNNGFAYAAWDDFGRNPTSFFIFNRIAGTFDRNILNSIF